MEPTPRASGIVTRTVRLIASTVHGHSTYPNPGHGQILGGVAATSARSTMKGAAVMPAAVISAGRFTNLAESPARAVFDSV